MKILFIIQGEGRGHLTQALSLRQKLTDEGHQVVGVLVGKSPARRLPDFFSKKIEAPVMLFSAGKDNLVSNAAQERFVRKLNKNRPESAELVKFPESKHEIFNAENTIAEEYWKKVFDFFES